MPFLYALLLLASLEMLLFLEKTTFKHLRMDIFKALFKDDTECNEIYLNALGIILLTSKLTTLRESRLMDLISMVNKVPSKSLTCNMFPSLKTEDSRCDRPKFWDLYFLLVAKTNHNTSDDTMDTLYENQECSLPRKCQPIINNETFHF